MLLEVKPGHTCDVISVVAEFMVDVARGEAQHGCSLVPHPVSGMLHVLTVYPFYDVTPPSPFYDVTPPNLYMTSHRLTLSMTSHRLR
jgi:hypothetical protein